MAPRSPTIRVPIAGQRYPRLTQSGQLLSNQQIGQNIDNWVNSVFEEELRLTAFLDVNTRRQIRLATGIGDMTTYVEQFNNGFAQTSQLASKDKSIQGKEAFGEAWNDRPRLKKISIEGRIVYKPKAKT
ncbi:MULTISPECIES: hypothetical protein [unclassified Microcoleus]|uniref:hypothetical protein n=1 Tax=unclassified Microcoleus TaxID=2642155 RepID=UPI002FD55295